jgi:DNA-binding transcriptional LysR family regulator
VLACAARSPWSAEFAEPDRAADLGEVAGWPLVLPEADAAIRKRWDELVRRQPPSATPTVAIEVGGWRVLLGYVQAGFGVGLVPRSVAATAGAKVKVRPLVPAIRPANRLSMVRLQERADTSLSAAFRSALTDTMTTAG